MAYFKNVLGGKENKYKRVRSKAVIPLDTEQSVREQFGWLPISVIRPERGKEWRRLIGDSGDELVDGKVWSNKSAVGGVTRLSSRKIAGNPAWYDRPYGSRGQDKERKIGVKASEFNPHIASLIVKYWSEEGDLIVDPFAGRATRGLVSLSLGRKYVGYEIAPSTFLKTKKKVMEYGGSLLNRDGCRMDLTKNESVDLVFTCPPYHQIEKYESTVDQLSDIGSYQDFLLKIDECAFNIERVLKSEGFCCWVCADWRVKNELVTFHADCIDIFRKRNMKVHDLVVIQNNSPFVFAGVSRAAMMRRTCKVHEYILVFKKP